MGERLRRHAAPILAYELNELGYEVVDDILGDVAEYLEDNDMNRIRRLVEEVIRDDSSTIIHISTTIRHITNFLRMEWILDGFGDVLDELRVIYGSEHPNVRARDRLFDKLGDRLSQELGRDWISDYIMELNIDGIEAPTLTSELFLLIGSNTDRVPSKISQRRVMAKVDRIKELLDSEDMHVAKRFLQDYEKINPPSIRAYINKIASKANE